MSKAHAGHNSQIFGTGVPTVFTLDAFSQVSGQLYQIDDVDRRIWDGDTIPSVFDNAVPVAAADIESFGYNFGEVTFRTGYVVTEPVTVTGEYLPRDILARVRVANLNMSYDEEDTTEIGEGGESNTLLIQRADADLELIDYAQTEFDTGRALDNVFDLQQIFVLEIQLRGPTEDVWRLRCHSQALNMTSVSTGTISATNAFSGTKQGDAELISYGSAA